MYQVDFRWKRSSDLVYLNQGKKKVERRKIEMLVEIKSVSATCNRVVGFPHQGSLLLQHDYKLERADAVL